MPYSEIEDHLCTLLNEARADREVSGLAFKLLHVFVDDARYRPDPEPDTNAGLAGLVGGANPKSVGRAIRRLDDLGYIIVRPDPTVPARRRIELVQATRESAFW